MYDSTSNVLQASFRYDGQMPCSVLVSRLGCVHVTFNSLALVDNDSIAVIVANSEVELRKYFPFLRSAARTATTTYTPLAR